MPLTKIELDALSNTVTANITSLTIGANVTTNTTTVFVGNSSVNTAITAGAITLSGVTVGTNASTLSAGTVPLARLDANVILTTSTTGINASALSTGTIPLARLSSANTTANGVVDTTTQTFAGDKTFQNATSFSSTVSITGAANALSTLGVSGTLSALGQLSVTGNATLDGNLTFTQSTLGNSKILGSRTDAQITITGGSAGSTIQMFGSTYTNYAGSTWFDNTAGSGGTYDGMWLWRNAGTERMRLTGAGLLTVSTNGIQTFGSGGTGNDGPYLYLNGGSGSSGGGPYIVLRRNGNSAADNFIGHNSSILGGNSNALTLYGQSSDGVAIYASHASGTMRFYSGGATERLRIDSSGNVGIGTSSQTSKLHVLDTNRLFNDYPNLSVMTSDAQAIDKGGRIGLGGLADTFIEFGSIFGRKENATAGNRAGYLGFATFQAGAAPTEWMRITSTGAVGIGTTSPLGLLNVNGDDPSLYVTQDYDIYGYGNSKLFLGHRTGTDNGQILYDSTYANLYIDNNYPADATYGKMFFRQNISSTPTTVMSINNGRVGIGTTSPAQKLDVNGNITTSGYVGIGTTSPTEKLHVAGAAIRLSDAGNTDGAYLQWQSGTTYFSNGGSSGNIIKLDTGSQIQFWTGVSWVNGNAMRWNIDSSGNFNSGTVGVGQNYVQLNKGANGSSWGNSGTSSAKLLTFYNSNGDVGSIATSGSATSYATSSDARLKRDLGVAKNVRVLQDTIVHDFEWLVDGQADTGVFAQEAQIVKPSAITVGSDEYDASGNLLRPWQTDYSKFVPDLIVGWQQHDSQVAVLERRIAALEARLAALER